MINAAPALDTPVIRAIEISSIKSEIIDGLKMGVAATGILAFIFLPSLCCFSLGTSAGDNLKQLMFPYAGYACLLLCTVSIPAILFVAIKQSLKQFVLFATGMCSLIALTLGLAFVL